MYPARELAVLRQLLFKCLNLYEQFGSSILKISNGRGILIYSA